MAEVTYIEHPDGPMPSAEYDGQTLFLFGAFKVQLDGGFVYLSPDHGFYASPGLIEDEEFRAVVIARAESIRADLRSGVA